MSQQANVNIVILAAGGSRRMGEQKLLKKLCGKSLVRRAAETALKSRASRVFAVIGSDAEQVRQELAGLPIILAKNENWENGQGTSVAYGVSVLGPCDAAILMAADQPFVTAEHLNLLIEAWETGQTGFSPAIYVSASDSVQGIPALFSAALFPELEKLSGDKGARQLFGRYGVCPVMQEDPMFFWDTDTEDAFRQAEEAWLRRCGTAK